MPAKKFFLRCKNRLYLSVIIFLGMFSIPLTQSCSNPKDQEKEQQRIKDSIAAAQHFQDSLNQAKNDSIANALRQQEIQDSIKRADSVAKARKKHKPVNPYKPTTPTTKYGVPVDMQ